MDSSSNDEIICTAKGYFQKEKHISELKIIFRRPSWLITREPRSSLIVELTPHFTHKFFNKKAHQSPLRPKPRSVQSSTWYVEWCCSPEEELSSAVGETTKFVFATNQAAEARSLDRGLRIAKTSLEKKPQSHPRSVQKNTRYNNYAPDPTLLQLASPTHGESKICHDLNNHLKPQLSSQNARKCSSCGKPLPSSRRVRCWARLSSILCCTSEFDHLLSEKPAL